MDADQIRILVIDDEEGMRFGCRKVLERRGYSVETAGTGSAGLEILHRGDIDLALVDYKLPDTDGMAILDEVRRSPLRTLCIMITAYATLESAVAATKKGAYDFLAKPFTPAELNAAIDKAVEYIRLQREAERLKEEKKRVRLEFVRIVSHELKAPLAAIEGYLTNLTCGYVTGEEAQKKVLERCKARAEGMRKLIQDLLDLTRVETGTKERNLSEVNLAELLNDVIEVFEPQAAERSVAIKTDIPVAPVIVGELGELRIIFTNLVSNAVKYNREGGEVKVSMTMKGEDVVVSVTDTGIGMTPLEQEKLFGEFFRAKNDMTKNIPGTGLGLSIVRKLVELNEGRISVSSEFGKGSRFTVTLPVRQTGNAPETAAKQSDSAFKY